MKQYNDVIVIGGGAAGMTAAISAAERNKNVVLLEKADRPGRKILASGNGRCNMMNSGDLRYYGDREFAEKVFRTCSRQDIVSFFNRYGLMIREESEGRIYPITNQSSSVLSALKNAMAITSVKTVLKSQVISTQKRENRFFVRTANEYTYVAEKIIVACGGAAQPKLGGSEDGYILLEKLGHSRAPVHPSLVPLITDKKSVSGLSGTRIRCSVYVKQNNHTIHTEDGEVLFTDYGVSGICIMQCARFVTIPGSYLELDLLKDAFGDKTQAVKELVRRRQTFLSGSPVWLLNGILPEKLSYAVLKQAGLPLRGEKCGDMTDNDLEKIIETAFRYRIMLTGTKGFEQAQVTAGGIRCAEFDPSSMESKIVQGLFAAGEVLNVDGDCGGFNLMFAFASGMIAGQNI